MHTKHSYHVNVSWKHDRMGMLHSPELNSVGTDVFSAESLNDLAVATPPEFPKGMPGIWSPEHLFTAAVNSCLMTTFLSIAENSKLEFKEFTSTGTGILETVEGKYLMTEVILEPVVTIFKEEDRAKTEKILHKSEANCLISNSVKSKITFQPHIVVV